jgi:hypothetical protein
MQVFFIHSLDVTLQIHMFNISPLLNAPKIEKTENGVEGYKTPFRTQTAGISISRAKIA